MARSTTGKIHARRKSRIFKDVKGFRGGRRRLLRTAKDARRKSLQNSYKDRRKKKRDFRTLWIIRIGAAARLCGITYGRLISGLKKSNIDINRKMLAEIAVKDMNAFKDLVEKIKQEAA